ncbi:MAG: uncharacterized protein QOG63_215 [Thermoleophilaceae bacterium]|nr:uncharacterized protein [Thermoleophilaceae bacterium]
MKFENEFQVEAPVDEVYAALLDLERIAPAMPGAQVTDQVGDDAYKVAIKVKVGPMTMNYKGDVTIGEQDPEAHEATLHVKVREARGQGNATAHVKMDLHKQDGGTHARIDADVQLAGKAAAMGRGLIEDVSAKLVNQFADNLASMLGGPGEAAPEQEQAAPPPQHEEPRFERQDSIDAFALAGGATADRLKDPKTLAGVLLAVLLLGWLLRSRA